MRPPFAMLLLAALPPAAIAHAQAPAGPEFLISEATNIMAERPSVAAGAPGEFVVVWRATDAGNASNIFGRRFAGDGSPLGDIFQANVSLPGWLAITEGTWAVDAASDGRFVVVWELVSDDARRSEVFARRFAPDATPLGDTFQVNAYTTGRQRDPSVAMGDDGRFLILWESPVMLPFEYPYVWAHRYDAVGNPVGTEFRVSRVDTRNEAFPAAAVAADGRFVATWTDNAADVSVQRFDASGTRLGDEFLVSSANGRQQSSRIVMNSRGDFTIVWDTAGWDEIFLQRFDAEGTRLGAEVRVNRATYGQQTLAAVAQEPGGGYFVSWADEVHDGDGWGIFGQVLDAQGRHIGSQFQINTYTTGPQQQVSAAADSEGRVLVAWTSFQDGTFGVRARRYGGLRPVGLTVDAPGNGVAEPGELAAVAPSWRNTTSTATSVSGTLGSFGGPTPAAYTITDGSADYGLISGGGTASCGGDCYLLSATAPARPALHWDGRFLENLASGHVYEWRLHLGDSFVDVPRTSPYYRFVETLLHCGVTGGCSATSYCPSSATTREQMAVFVLVAKERGDYAPLACTTPVFTDVPASSPFCRWVEELARRGVVSGCGGGSYCPADPVTREQMAVFVLRTLDPGLDPPACTTPVFSDVPASSPYCRWIEELARRGVVSGCGNGNYCPADPVTREQMAVFLSPSFGLTLYGP